MIVFVNLPHKKYYLYESETCCLFLDVSYGF